MSLNTKQTIRCRESLKPYYQKRVRFIGYLKSIGLNQNIQEKINNDHNALFVDVHSICIVRDNPDEEIYFDVDLDHIHCQIKNRHLDQYLNQFVTFSAKIDSYVSTYHLNKYKSQKETRYGLTDLMIETTHQKDLHNINRQYRQELTTCQAMTINNILKQFPKNFPNRRLFAINEITTSLLKFASFTDRTNFLLHTAATLYEDPQALSNRKIKFFTEDPAESEHFDIHKYQTLKTDFNQSQTTIAKLEDKLIQQKIQYQGQLSRYQKVTEQQSKKIKFYQTVDKYLPSQPKPEPADPDQPLATTEQLDQLKDRFNQS